MYSLAKKLFLSCALALAAASANAATVTATYTGTIGEGYDNEDLFGLGSDLAGVAFRMVFIYDTAIGQYPGGPGSDQISGGFQVAGLVGDPELNESPMLWSILTINEISHNFPVNTYNYVIAVNDGAQNSISHFSGGYYQGEGFAWLTESSSTNAIPADLDAPLDLIGSGIASPFDSVEVAYVPEYSIDQGAFWIGGNNTAGSFKVERLEITVAAVPLPGALPMFLMALIGVGMLHRRSRKPETV